MKKNIMVIIVSALIIGIVIFCAVLAIVQGRTKIRPAISSLPEDYSLKDAKKDGYVIYENLDITQGQEKWDKFISASEAGKSCAVRVIFSDSEEKLEIYDLSFNGNEYTLRFLEKGELVSETYRYLLKSEEVPPIPSISTLEKRITYFLADEPNLTWTQVVQSELNETLNGTKAYRNKRVYCNSIYKTEN